MSSAVTHESEGHEHPAHVAHHFDSAQHQFDSGKLGIWLFLAQEVLFFSGVFCVYAVYRSNHPEIFVYAHRFLDVRLGALNTAVLILSSLTAAWAVRAAQLGQKRVLVFNLVATILLAFTFLGVKSIEYEHKWKEGLLWGKHYHPSAEAELHNAPGPTTGAAAIVAEGHGEAVEPKNVQIFFGIYFIMTGLHGLHVIAGIILFLWLLRRALRDDFGPDRFGAVDYGALYWHLVDLVWIYLFPLLYLIH
jgi:cytochrome c oxidase subunit 3